MPLMEAIFELAFRGKIDTCGERGRSSLRRRGALERHESRDLDECHERPDAAEIRRRRVRAASPPRSAAVGR